MKLPFNVNEHNSTYTTARPVTADELISTARDLIAARFSRGSALSSPDESRDYLITQLAGYEHEVFCCLFLDNRHRVIEFRQLFRGTIDGCSVHPREVVKTALLLNTAAVIFAHNRPSGVAEPSRADQTLTRRLHDALALVEVRVLDHIVVGGAETVSFAEWGCYEAKTGCNPLFLMAFAQSQTKTAPLSLRIPWWTSSTTLESARSAINRLQHRKGYRPPSSPAVDL